MYYGNWQVVTPPTSEPVTLLELKQQLRIETDFNLEDAQLLQYIAAARNLVEEAQGRQLMPATWKLYLDSFPPIAMGVETTLEREVRYLCPSDRIKIPRPPLASVTSITYVDSDGASQTLATSVYQVITSHEPGFVRLKYNQSWPSVRYQPEAVTITYVCGYADAATVPAATKQAILLLAASLYNEREGTSQAASAIITQTLQRLQTINAVAEVV